MMKTAGEEPGPGREGANDKAGAGAEGASSGGEMRSERQERGQSMPSPPGHCEDFGFYCDQGSWAAPRPDSLLCDDQNPVRREQKLKGSRGGHPA